ncbi:MAG: hypothetical protein HKN39_04825 [Flavobacteriales bacterium]|nr:hypothetical protein [Flavobacteriales bacterium]
MADINTDDLIIQAIKDKACLKRNVFENLLDQWSKFKEVIKNYHNSIEDDVKKFDKRIRTEFTSRGDYACRLTVGGDTLIFHMHTNVFQFDAGSHVWKTGYIKEDEERSFVGVIHVYNFLYDSLSMNRVNDLGYMIGRIFINKDNHFLVEGKRQLGYLFNDFIHNEFTEEKMKEIIQSALLYTLGFDLYVPPYNQIQVLTVSEILELSSDLKIQTGKRLGFEFSSGNMEMK